VADAVGAGAGAGASAVVLLRVVLLFNVQSPLIDEGGVRVDDG
jgi:hypothetical protein